MSLYRGTKLGPYEILAPVGAGGMGEVYKARDTRLDRVVAIKVSVSQFSERFEREARAVAALNHPNICQLYDVGPDYLVMEYIEGTPVAPIDTARKLLDIAVQIADGLAAAHDVGITHRDLKPANILVTREGRVKILDFGLAKQVTGPKTGDATRTMNATGAGTILGTAAYMSPEQAKGEEADARSDQFSFGLIVYEMAAGKRPFPRDSAAETMAAIIRDEAPPLPAHLPAPVHWVVERCLAKDPAERYDSTRDLWRELRQVREHLSDVQAPVGVPPARARKRRLPTVGVAAAALIIGFAIAAFWPATLPDAPQMIPFATEHEIQVIPSWSSKGDRVAYAADVDGVLQIFTKSLGSSTPTQVTREKQSCFHPLWSPDATRIYFLTGTKPNGTLRSIAVAGGPSERIFDHVVDADLSPGGDTLALLISDVPGRFRLAFSSPPGAPPRFYSRAPLSDFNTTGSSSHLRFDSRGEYLGLYTARSHTEFWRIPIADRPPEELLRGAGFTSGRFTWLNGSARIIQDRSPNDATSHLLLVDLLSHMSRVITSGGSRDINPSLSRDGGTLAFASGQAGYEVIEVPLNGSAPRDLVATARNNVAPAWAPDGTHFAYSTDRSGAPEIWLRNRTDGSERLIVSRRELPAANVFNDCAISPDGGRVAYRALLGGETSIWISPLTGEPPVRLWQDPAKSPQRGPSWSPQGDWIAYYGVHEGRPAVMKVRVGGSAAAEFLATANRPFPVRWSPRGDWIAYYDNETLRLVSADGKQNRPLSRGDWQTYGWSKDGAEIYGIVATDGRRLTLVKADIANSRETEIADLGPVPAAFDQAYALGAFSYRGFSLHPDRKSFLTSVWRMKTQIYLMQDFDRRVRLADSWWRWP
jgi:serine/threonine protein kinase